MFGVKEALRGCFIVPAVNSLSTATPHRFGGKRVGQPSKHLVMIDYIIKLHSRQLEVSLDIEKFDVRTP